MALIECPECGKKVSSQAVACPQCGFPVQKALIKAREIAEDCRFCGYHIVQDGEAVDDKDCDVCQYCAHRRKLRRG